MSKFPENDLKEKIKAYKYSLEKMTFSVPEKKWISTLDGEESPEELIDKLIEFNIELNSIIDNCPECITVMDNEGTTMRVNKAFQEVTGMKSEDVLDKNISDLEKDGYFKPSIFEIVKREKRSISLIQEGKAWNAIATGAPIYDDQGNLYRVVSNARELSEIQEITTYVEKEEKEKDSESNIIAESNEMKEIMSLAKQVAGVDSNILITGESGVGKGVLARYIHLNGPRKDGEFVEINCGAIPDSLLESELFGYESGAFTGAKQKGKPGLIEIANKGTLFLDEIGEIPMMMQVKLLNFLQSHKIMRIGGIKEKKVDIRVIAATNKDLVKLVSENKFRDDLFYRLNVIPIYIPPLRKRIDDIYPAACYFAKKYCSKYHKKIEFTDEFLETLKQYEWKGNMRELENFMERIVVISSDNANSGLLRSINENNSQEDTSPKLTLQEKLDKYEGELVRKEYEKTPNTYKVAEALGISQPSASRKIKKYVKNF